MARVYFKNKKPWSFASESKDPERDLANEICKTGKIQIRLRRKAGFSAFYLKEGRLIEALPDKTIIEKDKVSGKWLTVKPEKRFFVLK